MTARTTPSPSRRRSTRIRIAEAAVLTVLATGCGSSGPTLTAPAEAGRQIAQTSGCPACHGLDGEGKTGPAWVGLAGAERTLDDGTTVIADTDYLRRSIMEPTAQQIAGYTIEMPVNSLDEADVDAVVAYIQELK